jgi:hypothetical protein
MATNKTKRSIHLAQPQPQRRSSNPQPIAGLMPVKAHIYHAIADLNGGFKLVIQSLRKLQQMNVFPSDQLAAQHDLVCNLRAEASRDFMRILQARETANADHFVRLRDQRGA